MISAPRILASLAVGLATGALLGRFGMADGPVRIADLIGGLWLDGLRMTIVPLVFLLIVTGVSSAARTGANGVARRVGPLFAALLLGSALAGAVLGGFLLSFWTPPEAGLLNGLQPAAKMPPLPAPSEIVRNLVPTNPVAAAANGAIVPLTVFALVFGLALSRLSPEARAATALFDAALEAMLLVVRWVLLLAPAGVFALALGAAGRIGLGLGGALLWYVGVQIAVTLALALAMYGLVLLSPVRLRAFAAAAAPAQAIAFSTQSSLASLPAMVSGCARLKLDEASTGATLPLAVAVFRIAAPASIVVVTLTLARLGGVEIGPYQLGIVILLATLNTLVIAGLPNQITFFAAYAPPAIAAGVPIELLPLMLAIDTVPDMFYTVTNVTADMTAATLTARRPAGQPDGQPEPAPIS